MRDHLVIQQLGIGLDVVGELVVAQHKHARALIRQQVVVANGLEVEPVGIRVVAAEVALRGRCGNARQLVAGKRDRIAAEFRDQRRTGREMKAATRCAR